MSNVNRPNNSIDDDDDTAPLLNEINSESTTIDQTYPPGCLSISSQQSISLSQMAVDERSNDSDEITDERLDDLTSYQSRSRRSSTPTNESDISTGESRPWTQDSVFDYVFAANRDEQSSDRIAQPSDAEENILLNFLYPVFIYLIFELTWNNIPFGIEDTQPHTMVLPVLINTPSRDIIINHENDDINEDGTIFNDTDDFMNDENMNSTITATERGGNQMILRESIGTETIDEVTNNVNSIVSTDAQDNNDLDNDNQDEGIMEHDMTSETIHQDNSNSDNNERGQVSLSPEHEDHNDIVQTNVPTAPILTSSIPTTSISGSSEQAEDIESNLAGPTDNNNHMMDDPVHLLATDLDGSPLNAHIRKEPSSFDSNEEIEQHPTV